MVKQISVGVCLPALLLLASCKKDEAGSGKKQPVTQLDLRVTDSAGAPVSGAKVQLFSTYEDWQREVNPVQVATSAANGNARFLYLSGTHYFVDAAAGTSTNWETQNELGLEAGAANLASVTISENTSGKLSSAEGKVWTIISYKVNGTDHLQDSCVTDNRWIFYKGFFNGRFVLNEGLKSCAAADPQERSGTWSASFPGAPLLITADNVAHRFYLEYLTDRILRLEEQMGGNTYRYVLESY